MPNFPRGAKAMPRMTTWPRFPEALVDWGVTGKGQFRAMTNMGRSWQEVYPAMNASLATVRALLQAVNRSLREATVWDVRCLVYQSRLGTGGSSPTVSGGGQTGSSLSVSGSGSSGWLKAGDIIKVAGCAVVFDVTGDATSSIPINPPIFAGQSPSSGAAVTIDPTQIFFKAICTVESMPDIDLPAGIVQAGLTLTFKEQPQ
jgi:hypothetical protein